MKFNDFKSLIKDKDISNENVQKEIFDSINNDINSIVKTKEEKFNELNTQAQESKKSLDELNKKLQSTNEINSKLKNSLYITRTVNQKLDDESIDDIITLAKKRVNENTSIEQAIDLVAKKFFIPKKEEKLISQEVPVTPAKKVNQSYSSPVGVISTPKTEKEENPIFSALGLGKNKKNKQLFKQF